MWNGCAPALYNGPLDCQEGSSTPDFNLVSKLLGDGLRLFDHGRPLTLERTRMLGSPSVTHLRFRVVK